MDIQSLSRRELQSLCKLHKIPANMTNIAMADALKSLETVQGVEQFFNASRSAIELPEKFEVMSPAVPPTSCRTSIRQKVKKTVGESLHATTIKATCPGVRRQLAGETNELLQTPMVSSLRKGTKATCQDTVKKETAVQRAYSTRRSVRLTEKKSEVPSVTETGRSQPIKIDMYLDEVSVTSEKDLGNHVQPPERSVGSGSGSIETTNDSNLSFENTDDNVGGGSVEYCDVGLSKAKEEDICNAFEKLDVLVLNESSQNLMTEKVDCCGEIHNMEVKSVDIYENVDSEEKHIVEEKYVLNEVDDNLKPDSEQKLNVADEKFDLSEASNVSINDENTVLVLEEKSDSLFSDKTSLLSETEDIDANVISFDTENPSEPSKVVAEENISIDEEAVAMDEKPKSSNEISIRQLKKQLKALSIKNNMNIDKDDKVGEARPALQAVCDNQLATGELEK